jgi:fibronectin-binding autotransporter adhesin
MNSDAISSRNEGVRQVGLRGRTRLTAALLAGTAIVAVGFVASAGALAVTAQLSVPAAAQLVGGSGGNGVGQTGGPGGQSGTFGDDGFTAGQGGNGGTGGAGAPGGGVAGGAGGDDSFNGQPGGGGAESGGGGGSASTGSTAQGGGGGGGGARGLTVLVPTTLFPGLVVGGNGGGGGNGNLGSGVYADGGGGGGGGHGIVVDPGLSLFTIAGSSVTGGDGGNGGNGVATGVGSSFGGGGGAGGAGIVGGSGSTIAVGGTVQGGNGGNFGTGTLAPVRANSSGGAGIVGAGLTVTIGASGAVVGGIGGAGGTGPAGLQAPAIDFIGGDSAITFGGATDGLTGDIRIATGATATLAQGNGVDVTIDSGINGGGSLAKDGADTVTVSGVVNLGGDVNVDGGTLALTNGSNSIGGDINVTGTLRLGATGAAGGATINMLGSSVDYADGVTNASAINIDSNSSQLNVDAGSATQSGVISETDGPRPLEKTGAGTLTLSAANTFTGPMTITGGTLTVTGGAALADAVAVNVAGGATFNVAQSEAIGSLAGVAGSSATIAAGQTLTTGGNNASTEFAGVISGANGALTKAGTGTFTLSGSNTYTGGTTISAGTLAITNDAALGTGIVQLAGGGLLSDGDVSLAQTVFGSGNIAATTGSTLTLSDLAMVGPIATPSTVSIGSATNNGVVTVNGTTSQSTASQMSIDGGTLRIGSAAAGSLLLDILAGTSIASGAALDITGGNTTVRTLTGTGTVTNSGPGARTLRLVGAANFGGVIEDGSGGGTVTLAVQTGSHTLSGANTYTGGTTISGGTLALSGVGTLGGATGLTLVTGGTLDLGGTSQTQANLLVMGGAVEDGTMNVTTFSQTGGTVTADVNADYSVVAIGGTINANGPGGITVLTNDAAGIQIETTAAGVINSGGHGVSATVFTGNGAIDITTDGDITADLRGITGSTQSAGAITISVNDGTVTSGERAISGQSLGGSVTVNVADGVALSLSNPSGFDGIIATSSGANGNVEVNFAGELNSDIFANAAGTGTATVNTSGDITSPAGTGAIGVFAVDGLATANVTDGTILATGPDQHGINIVSNGTGGVNVSQTGGAIGTVATPVVGNGINATSSGASGDVTVSASNVEASGRGVLAMIMSGTGDVSVTALAGGTIEGGLTARNAGSGSSTVVIQDGATVNGNSPGSESVTAGGDATQTIGNNATVTGSSGVVADQTSAAGAGNVTVTVGTGSTITGDGSDAGDIYNGNGIFAGNRGTGTTSVTVGTGTTVTGDANGIFAAQTNALNTNDIIVDVQGSVSGDGNTAFALAPYATQFSGAGVPTTGLGIGVSNAGTGAINITTGAGTIDGSNIGISALGSTGNIAIVTGAGAVTGGTDGIRTETGGAGTVAVTTGGNVTGTAGTGITTAAADGQTQINIGHDVDAGTIGVDANGTGTGTLDINQTAGTITAGTIGIDADQTGAGAIDIDVTGGAINGTTQAVTANATTGTVNIDVAAGVGVGAVSGNVIEANTTTGDIVVNNAADLTSTGAVGILAYSLTGRVEVQNTGTVNAGGPAITAVIDDISASDDVVVNSSGALTGDGGIFALNDGTGNVDVNSSAGIVVTTATNWGVQALAFGGGNVDVNTTTDGALDGGTGGIVAVAIGGDGNVTVTTNGVIGGTTAPAVVGTTAIAEGLGTATVTANAAVTAGFTGIAASSVDGAILVNGAGAATGGRDGITANATGAGNVSITQSAAVTGSTGTGIIATAVDGTVTVTPGSTVTGGTDGIVATSTGGAVIVETSDDVEGTSGDGIRTSSGTTTTLTVNAGDTVTGGTNAIVTAGGTFTGTNDGTITTAAGNAINATGGTATFTNNVAAVGMIASSAGATLDIVNNGTWTLLTDGASTLAGTDSFANTATGVFNANGNTTLTGLETFDNQAGAIVNINGVGGAAGSMNFAGATAFSNAGTIDMQNGVLADNLVVAGDFVGNGGVLNFDLDLTANNGGGAQLSDFLTVGGIFSGTTTVNFALQPGQLALQDNPILVIDTGTTAAGTMVNANGLPLGGLILYDLQQIGEDWFVTSALNLAGPGGIAGNISLVQSIIGSVVNRPSSPFVSGLVQPEPNEERKGFWMRGVGGTAKGSSTAFDVAAVSPASRSTVELDYLGAQAGFDSGRYNIGDKGLEIAVGVTAGYNFGNSRQDLSANLSGITTAEFDSRFAGAYVSAFKGRLFADLQVRFDQTDFTFTNATLGLNDAKTNSTRGSLIGSVGYGFTFGDFQFVPSVGMSLSTTRTDRVTFTDGAGNPTATLDPMNYASYLGFASATVARQFLLPDEVSAITPFVTAAVYNDFGDNPTSLFTDLNSLATVMIQSENLKTYGELSLGVNYLRLFEENLRQLDAGIRADFKFGRQLEAVGVTAQMRLVF